MSKALDWKAAIWAGIIALLVYVMIAMTLMMMRGTSPWGPPRMMAAIVMGKGVFPPMGETATFDLGIMMLGTMVHLVLSIIPAIVLGWGISRFGFAMAAAIIVGAIFGIIVYYVDFNGFTSVFS